MRKAAMREVRLNCIQRLVRTSQETRCVHGRKTNQSMLFKQNIAAQPENNRKHINPVRFSHRALRFQHKAQPVNALPGIRHCLEFEFAFIYVP